MNQSYFIKGFPDYRLVRLSDRDFCVLSNKKGYWEEIGHDDGYGHIKVDICVDGYIRHTSVHVLVAEMFVPNPEGKTHVHHIDFDATNNDPANLIWLTPSEHSKIHANNRSEETRKKISESKMGHPTSEEARIKMRNAKIGMKHTEEWKKEMSERMKGEGNPFFGRLHSEETRKKISSTRKKKRVEQLSLDGKHIEYYESIRDAARKTGIRHDCISKCCRGLPHHNTAGGYKWRYVD